MRASSDRGGTNPKRGRRRPAATLAPELARPYPDAMQATRTRPQPQTEEQPRYQQILATLRERIVAGHYPVGSNLPTEVELCGEFDVSRYTVREALRRLVDQGLLARRQGSGSEVVSAEAHQGFIHHVRTLADLFQYALDTHFDIRSMREVRVGAELAALVGGEAGSSWLLIKGIRRTERGGGAICVTHSYIPQRLAWLAPEIPTVVGPFYALLEERANEPIVDAVQEIKAEPMAPSVAAGLGAQRGDFALRLLRRYSSRKGTLVASFNWHPAGDFTYRMQLQRSRLPRGEKPDF
ncbi:MAG: GntR family transcriptional regulator [Rhizobiaceae bacterium]|nr:GntR family transcriptional regulator [Rhizobiaceae bacterium]